MGAKYNTNQFRWSPVKRSSRVKRPSRNQRLCEEADKNNDASSQLGGSKKPLASVKERMSSPGYESDTTVILSDNETLSVVPGSLEATGTVSTRDAPPSRTRNGAAHGTAHGTAHADIDTTAGTDGSGDGSDATSDRSSHDYGSDPVTTRSDLRLARRGGWLPSNESDSDDSGRRSGHGSRCSSSNDHDSDDDGHRNGQFVFVGSDRSELGDPQPSTDPYTFISRHGTKEEAVARRDAYEGFVYGWFNNGASRKRKNDASRPPTQPPDPAHFARDKSLKALGIRWTSNLYVCMSHSGCDHRMQITRVFTEPPCFELSYKGEHTGRKLNVPRFGIDIKYRSRVSTMVKQNFRPSAIRSILLEECRRQEKDETRRAEEMKRVPSLQQIQNCRSYKQRSLVYTVQNVNDVLIWIYGRRCETPDVFHGSTDPHELLVLRWFQHEGSFGFVFSTRAVFGNVKFAVEGQPDELLCSADGTYKIHFGGWVLVICGSVGVVYDASKGRYIHRFFPWAYMFVLTETAFAYTTLFETVKDCAMDFYGVELNVMFGSLDHSDAIACAFEHVWPAATLLPCWTHLTRATKKHAQKQGLSDFYKHTIKEDLHLLHQARTAHQFSVMAKAVLKDWQERGARTFADYFEEIYLSDRWRRWFITAAETPGVVPRQQAIEAHNKAVKAAIGDILRANTARVLTEALPRIVIADGTGYRATDGLIRHYCSGPTPTQMLLRAQHLTRTQNHHIRRVRGRINAFVFNSRETMVVPDEARTSSVGTRPNPITRSRVDIFLRSLRGRVPGTMNVNEMYSALGSLHFVEVLHDAPLDPIPLSTHWTLAQVVLYQQDDHEDVRVQCLVGKHGTRMLKNSRQHDGTPLDLGAVGQGVPVRLETRGIRPRGSAQEYTTVPPPQKAELN